MLSSSFDFQVYFMMLITSIIINKSKRHGWLQSFSFFELDFSFGSCIGAHALLSSLHLDWVTVMGRLVDYTVSSVCQIKTEVSR